MAVMKTGWGQVFDFTMPSCHCFAVEGFEEKNKAPSVETLVTTSKAEPFAITDPDEAKEKLKEMLAQGIRPLISVPPEYVEGFEERGLFVLPKVDLLSGKRFSAIVGTIGREPYLPPSESARAVFEVDPANLPVVPRFTGTPEAFSGIVVFPKGIPACAITKKGFYTLDAWRTSAAKEEPPREEGVSKVVSD